MRSAAVTTEKSSMRRFGHCQHRGVFDGWQEEGTNGAKDELAISTENPDALRAARRAWSHHQKHDEGSIVRRVLNGVAVEGEFVEVLELAEGRQGLDLSEGCIEGARATARTLTGGRSAS